MSSTNSPIFSTHIAIIKSPVGFGLVGLDIFAENEDVNCVCLRPSQDEHLLDYIWIGHEDYDLTMFKFPRTSRTPSKLHNIYAYV